MTHAVKRSELKMVQFTQTKKHIRLNKISYKRTKDTQNFQVSYNRSEKKKFNFKFAQKKRPFG